MDLKKLLGDELYNQLMEKIGDKKVVIFNEGDMLSKEEVANIVEENTQYKIQLEERDLQLKELKVNAVGNEQLISKITELENLNKATKEEYETNIITIKKDTAIDLKLKDEKAKNIKAVKALLDLNKVTLDGEKLIGLDEQVKSLKETDSYLFGEDIIKGIEPNLETNPLSPEYKNNPWKKETFNLTAQGRILKEDPELAKKLMQAAK